MVLMCGCVELCDTRDAYGPCEYVSRIRSPAVVAETDDGGLIKVTGEEKAVEQYCAKRLLSVSRIHGLASWLLPRYVKRI